jgi:hypothetical protein
MRRLAAAVAVLALSACGQPKQEPATPAPPAAPAATQTPDPVLAPTYDAWVGRWLGPEGLFLDVKARNADGVYPITLKDNLDTQADYLAEPTAGGLAFHRGDDAIVVRPGTGAQTGFKYLAGKTDCLILVAGQEGYCRD